MAIVLRQPKRVYLRKPKRLPLIEQYPLYTLSFDGVDDYVAVPHNDVLNVQSHTVELWLYERTLKSWNPFAGLIRKGYTDYSFQILLYPTGEIKTWLKGTDESHTSFSLGTITLNKWYHIAYTYDGSYVTLYLNGVALTSTAYSKTLTTNTEELRIGEGGLIGSRTPDGLIALPCIYNRPLSQGEIQHNIYNPLSPVRDGLVLFLPMLEGLGTAVYDYSGQGNNGTLYGGVSWRELMKYELPAAAGL
jgi:hypothetical protein